MTKDNAEPAAVATGTVLLAIGPSGRMMVRQRPAGSLPLRRLRQTSSGYAPKQRREHPCRGRRRNKQSPAVNDGIFRGN